MRIQSTLSVSLAIASVLILGTVAATASADERRGDHAGGDHRDYRGHQSGWGGGGYYPAPPVVYGPPAYYPPPVVYGPAVGIVLPGLSLGIR